MQFYLAGPNTHWLFAGRFVAYVLCTVLIWGTVLDWMTYMRGKAPRPVWTYHFTVIFASLAIMLATPTRYEVLRRLFVWYPSDTQVDELLFVGLLCACVFFIFAQVTRAHNRGASTKRIMRGVWFAVFGIVILALVGAGIDVRLP